MYIQKNAGNAPELREVFPKMKIGKHSIMTCWSSPSSMASAISKYDQNQAWHDSAWETGVEFRGTKTMGEAVQLAQNGWTEGVVKASRLLDKIRAANPLWKRPKRYGIAGTHPNVPRAIAGDVMNMHIPDLKKASRRPVITLLSDMAANCGHHKDELINRAAVVAALIDQIEASGYACDVMVYAYTQTWNNVEALSVVQVKNSNQPVDMARLAFGVGHPSMLRRFAFADWSIDDHLKGLGSGLGHVRLIDRTGLAERNIYVIPGVEGTSCFTTESRAEKEGLAYIIKSLQKQNFPVFADTKIDEKDVPDEEDVNEIEF